MNAKLFTIIYPDGSKKNVSARAREQLLLAGEIKHVDQNGYKWVGEVKTFHAFADLIALRDNFERSTTLRRFLPGQFVIEYPRRLGGRRVRELLQTPEAMVLRMVTQ